MTQGVVEQVVDDLLDPGLVREHRGKIGRNQRLDAHPRLVPGQVPDAFDTFLGDPGDIQRPAFEPKAAFVDPGHGEEITDHPREHGGLFLDDPEHGLLLLREMLGMLHLPLHRALDDRDRGPEFMRHVRDEGTADPVAGLDLGCHLVEPLRKPADLVPS